MQPSEGRRFNGSGSEIRQDAPPFVPCFWCDRSHSGEHPLSVCRACTARYAMMQSLEMSKAYALSDEVIDQELMRTSAGNYALGYMDGDTFAVFYVGRSDCDVRQRLHEWVGVPSRYESHASAAKASWGVHRRGQLPLDAPANAPVGSAESSYTYFAYSYARSADEAYAQECRNYDAFGGRNGLDNAAEPISVAHSSMVISADETAALVACPAR